MKLTDDQKNKMEEVNKSRQELNVKVLAALKSILTEEQQKSLPQARRDGAKGKKPAAGKKPAGGKKPEGDRKKKGEARKEAAE